MAIVRRIRLSDGSFGDLEKVMGGETDAEKVARLEAENERIKADNAATLEAVAELYELLGGGDAV